MRIFAIQITCKGIWVYQRLVTEIQFNVIENICISDFRPFLTHGCLRSRCESLRSLAHCNCVNFNRVALRTVLKPENMSWSAQAKQIVSVAVWITVFACFARCLNLYFDRLQNTGALEQNYFVFEKPVIERTSNTNTHMLRLCVRFKYTLPYISFTNRFSRCFSRCFQSFRSLFESISIAWSTGALVLNYFAFESFYLLPFLTLIGVALKGSLIPIFHAIDVFYKLRLLNGNEARMPFSKKWPATSFYFQCLENYKESTLKVFPLFRTFCFLSFQIYFWNLQINFSKCLTYFIYKLCLLLPQDGQIMGH